MVNPYNIERGFAMDIFKRQKDMFSQKEQKKLAESVVFLAGAGGLGTHQAVQLQRVGVKKIYIMDYDRIEASNLNRQILYGREDINSLKAEVAQKKLAEFDLETEIEVINDKITKNTEIPADVDIIMEALDNFETRYIINNLAKKYDLPVVHGGVEAWYGQLTTIVPGKTKDLKEIIPESPISEGQIPVFSPAVSIIASLQVSEAVKFLIGRKEEELLLNKIMFVDIKNYNFDIVELD